MQDERLERAISFVQAGNTEEARGLLEQILKDDRANIQAWHWYAQTWPTTKDKIRVWEACLRFNPTNEQAQTALKDLNPAPKLSVEAGTSSKEVRTTNRSSPFVIWGGIGILILVFIGLLFALKNSVQNALPKDPNEYFHAQPVQYYLYVPRKYSGDTEWPLFVGIHGAGGSGLDCWNMWQALADKEGFILLCPSIPGDAYGFRQDVGENTVWSAIGEVKKDYKVRNRMFFSGFSAGAFFIQGFTYHYPQYVSALSVLSAGVYLNPNLFPEVIPMTVVIGDADDPIAVQTSQLFVDGLRGYGFDIQYEVMPGVGHTFTSKAQSLTIELFRKVMQK